MHVQPIGLLGYQLYRLGWKNSLHKHLPQSQHWLLSILFVIVEALQKPLYG
jgi:hypothetical protein